MLRDELQQTWQSQAPSRLSIDPDVLLKSLRRKQRSFRTTIFWRDFREVGVAAGLAVFFLVRGLRGGGWTSFLLVGAVVFVGGFILVDRFLRRGQAAAFGDSLIGCVNASLAEVEHQIWLLKNVLWWYLLPLFIAIVVDFSHGAFEVEATMWAFEVRETMWERLGKVFIPAVFCAVVFAGIYWLNQYAVRAGLEPRRQELLAVREGLMQGYEATEGTENTEVEEER